MIIKGKFRGRFDSEELPRAVKEVVLLNKYHLRMRDTPLLLQESESYTSIIESDKSALVGYDRNPSEDYHLVLGPGQSKSICG